MPTLFKDFVEGEAIGIILVGDHAWQVRMVGEGWLGLIDDSDAASMPIDRSLVR